MIPCVHLRSKTVYGVKHRTALEWRQHHAEHRAHWSCLVTGQAWGPDGHLAASEECHPSRPCYEPDPALPEPSAWRRLRNTILGARRS